MLISQWNRDLLSVQIFVPFVPYIFILDQLNDPLQCNFSKDNFSQNFAVRTGEMIM